MGWTNLHVLCICVVPFFYISIQHLRAAFGYAINPLMSTGNCSATWNNMKLVHWSLMGGLLHWYSEERTGRVGSRPRSLLAVPCNSPPMNSQCTDHRIAMVRLLYSLNVPVKGLMRPCYDVFLVNVFQRKNCLQYYFVHPQ